MTSAVPPPVGRPVGSSSEETRLRILCASMRCIAEAGYARASIREIAKAAGVTSASLYHYFPTKTQLLIATVAGMKDAALPRLREAGRHGDTVAERIASVLDESNNLMRDYPYLAAFERATRVEGAAFAHGVSRDNIEFAVVHDIITEIIDDARRDGTLPADTDVAGTVNAIYAVIRGLSEMAASLPPEEAARALRAAKRLIRGTLLT